MFTARVWKNTGYNGINIPDSSAVLESLPYTDFPALDILTDINLSYVKLHGTQSDFENIDFVKIGGEYYKVFETPFPLNGDTWQIPLVYDGVTSTGINNLVFLDGIAERASVDDDTYGAHCIEDPLLTPSEPLRIYINPVSMDSKTIDDGQGNLIQNPNWSDNVFVETTIDLGLMACIDGSVVYTDSSGNEVVVPHSYPKMGRHTSYSFAGLPGVDTKTTLYPVPNNENGKSVVHEGVQKCRALGIESAIFDQVAIPSIFVNVSTQQQEVYAGNDGQAICHFADSQDVEHFRTDMGAYNGFGGETVDGILTTTYTFIRQLSGTTGTVQTSFDFDYSQAAGIKNKRVMYGGNNKVGILTTAGNRLESNPEELIGGGHTAPRITFRSDPHLNGCPYYRFEYMNGQDSSGQAFFFNAIKGLQWKKVPLIFQKTSGSALNTIAFENSRRIQDAQYYDTYADRREAEGYKEISNIVGTTASGMTTGFMSGNSMAAANPMAPAVGAGIGAVAGIGLGVAQAGLSQAAFAANRRVEGTMYRAQKLSEISAYAVKNTVSSPTVQVSYDAEAFRDFYGEVLFTYRYTPSVNDIHRFDKLLTMYGYKVAMPVNEIDLNSRTKFNYLEADVSIGGDIPMWKKEAIREQISAGVRIWHKKPSTADYLDNPIRS